MREPQQQTSQTDDEATAVGGEETTLVAPRFDDEETLVARPVVPFEDGAHVPAPEPVPARPARGYRSHFAPGRSEILALALASVLVGGVLGGAGLYLYQRQSQDPAVSPTATAAEQPADAAQAPAVSAEGPQPTPNAEPQEAQQAEAPSAAPDAAEPATPAPDEEVSAAAPARRPESVTAAERRPAPPEGAPRRGKKGERDEEIARRPAPRPDGNVARVAEPEARRVDSIVYRPRRATRRARRDEDVDRLRRIFEGTPE